MSRRWILLLLVFFGILISYIDRGNLSIAAPAMMHDFRLTPASMGVLLSAFFWTYAFFQIPAGLLVDRYGIRYVYAGAFLLWSVSSAAIALSHGSSEVMGLRLMLGLAESVGPLASLAFIRKNFHGSEQGLPVSIYIGGQTIGPACGALLGSKILAVYGWRTLFAVTGLGALLWIPLWVLFAPRHHARRATPKQGSTPVRWPWRSLLSSAPLWVLFAPRHHARRAAPKQGSTPVQWPWRSLLISVPLWAMCACVFFLSYYWYFVLTWMPSYLIIARGYSTASMGRIFSVPLFAMAVVNALAGLMADKLISSRRGVFKIRLAFLAVGLLGAGSILLLNVLPSAGLIVPVMVISICSFGVASSNFWAIAQYTAPSRIVGRAIGLLNTLSQIAGVAAPLVTGWTLGPQRNFALAIVIAGLAPIVGAALLVLAGESKLTQLKSELEATVA